MTEQDKKKKKLTVNTIGLLLLVVIAAAYFYVWKASSSTGALAFELSNNITITQLKIKTLDEPAADIDARLTKIKAELSATQTGFPDSVDRNEVIDYILGVAGVSHIDILPLQSDGWSTQKIGQQYRVLSLTATAEGSLKNVQSFITALQAGKYPTLVISECEVKRKDAALPGFPGLEMPVIVNLKVGIYTVTSWLTEESL
jgi:hypothetical protein